VSDRFTIAIHPDVWPLFGHQNYSFSERWLDYLKSDGHITRLVDATKPDFFDRMLGCDGLLWWCAPVPPHAHYSRRMLLALNHAMPELICYPDWKTCWHADDKISQFYLLRTAGIPVPRTEVFWNKTDAIAFCEQAEYPLVLKLRTGYCSMNVRLLRNAREARKWIAALFETGLFALKEATPRARMILENLYDLAKLLTFGRVRKSSDGRDLHQSYIFVQEFIPGNDFDIRVTVIGAKAFAYRRWNRPDDFRASGSGLSDPNPAEINLDAVRFGFLVARRLRTQCLCVDLLRQGDRYLVSEISYFFGWRLRQPCPGYWEVGDDGELTWFNSIVNPELLILEDFLSILERKKSGATAVTAAPEQSNTNCHSERR
jgi:RimK-like ATP-grasp domain